MSLESKTSPFGKIAVFLRPFRVRMLWMLLLTALIAIVGMIPPLLTRSIINDVIGGRRTEMLPLIIGLLIVTALMSASMGYMQVLGMAYIGQSFVMRVRTAVYSHMLSLSIAFFGRESTGMLVNRLMGDSSVLQQVLTVTSLQVVSDLISSVFAIAVTLFINWRLAIPLYILLTLFGINYKLKIRELRTLARSQRKAEDRVASGVQNRLVANLTVKTYGTEDREEQEFHRQSSLSLDLSRESQVASSMFWINTWLLRDVGWIIIFFMGCAMVLNGTASYGDVTAFLAYVMMLLWPAVRFSVLAQQLQNVRISADRLFTILDELPLIVNLPGARKIDTIRGEVSLENVSFGYVPETMVLDDISLHVKAGEIIALVGPTGCGKSTILSLLMRFYDVNSGSISIDGIDIKDFELRSLRQHFGIVLQESLLFTVSIADNIRYAKPSATLAQVEYAARIAEIHEEIMALPNGYNSVVGDREVQLSVGQKQRLAIARAILADPTILIMDEATSALDTNSEKAIQVAMDRFLTGRTAFIVAHRLSTIRNATRIVMLDGGKIAESGSHDELMEIPGGRYRKLYETHAGSGVLGGGDE